MTRCAENDCSNYSVFVEDKLVDVVIVSAYEYCKSFYFFVIPYTCKAFIRNVKCCE